MKYDISKPSVPAMPTLVKGTECIRLLLTQTSKDMREHLRSDAFPRTRSTYQQFEKRRTENVRKLPNPPLSAAIRPYRQNHPKNHRILAS